MISDDLLWGGWVRGRGCYFAWLIKKILEKRGDTVIWEITWWQHQNKILNNIIQIYNVYGGGLCTRRHARHDGRKSAPKHPSFKILMDPSLSMIRFAIYSISCLDKESCNECLESWKDHVMGALWKTSIGNEDKEGSPYL
jgi:hypothetical protein